MFDRHWLITAALAVTCSLLLAACNLPTPTPSGGGVSGDLYVDPSGNDSNDCLSWANACETIGAAISKASSGQTIAIAGGAYNELLTINQNLTLVGSGASSTAIIGGGSGPVITINSGAVALLDLTVADGDAAEGGCIRNLGADLRLVGVVIEACRADNAGGVFNAASIEIADSILRANTVAVRGGALYHAQGAGPASIEGSQFLDNSSPTTGTLSVGGAAIFNGAEMEISSSDFRNNDGKEAILSVDGQLTLRESLLEDNTFSGIHADGTAPSSANSTLSLIDTDVIDHQIRAVSSLDTRLTVQGGEFSDNGVGGISHSSGQADLTDIMVLNNGHALTSGHGGGLRLSSATVTLEEGEIRGNSSPEKGGGIYYEDRPGAGNLEIRGTLIENNEAQQGGGLYQASGTSEIILASFIGNSADEGGGIFARDDNSFTGTQRMWLTAVLVDGNQAAAGDGGGIMNWIALDVDGSSIVNNRASGQGGGIYNGVLNLAGPDEQPTVELLNSTLSGNQAQSGGGLANQGVMQINYVTIARNSATSSGGGLLASFNPPPGSSMTNTILAENTSGTAGEENCSAPGGGFDGGNVEDLDTCSLSNPSDKPNTDPMLGPLQNNGGVSTSRTHLPASNSPVIDAAIGSDCPPIDQRGVNRPQAAACDIGAVEVESPQATVTPQATSTPQVACEAALAFKEASFSSIAYRPERGDVLVILDVPGEMDQPEYEASINGLSYSCSRDEDFPNRLFCVGDRLSEGVEAELLVVGEGCTTPAYETTFSVPTVLYPTATPEATDTPEAEPTPTPPPPPPG